MKYLATLFTGLLFTFTASTASAEPGPYDVFPPADPPYYRVRYAASTKTLQKCVVVGLVKLVTPL